MITSSIGKLRDRPALEGRTYEHTDLGHRHDEHAGHAVRSRRASARHGVREDAAFDRQIGGADGAAARGLRGGAARDLQVDRLPRPRRRDLRHGVPLGADARRPGRARASQLHHVAGHQKQRHLPAVPARGRARLQHLRRLGQHGVHRHEAYLDEGKRAGIVRPRVQGDDRSGLRDPPDDRRVRDRPDLREPYAAHGHPDAFVEPGDVRPVRHRGGKALRAPRPGRRGRPREPRVLRNDRHRRGHAGRQRRRRSAAGRAGLRGHGRSGRSRSTPAPARS